MDAWSCSVREGKKSKETSRAAPLAERSSAAGVCAHFVGVEYIIACHGKVRLVDKDWRTVCNGLMVGCWRRLACVQPSCSCFLCSFPSQNPNRWLQPLRLPLISTTRRIAPPFFQDADGGTRMTLAWTESRWSPAETDVGRSRVFQRGVPPGMHRGNCRRRSLATGGASC